MIAISIPGLDHKYQMFTNDAKLDAPERAVKWIMQAGEHPPRAVGGTSGGLSAFVDANPELVVNKLWLATERADSAFRSGGGDSEGWVQFEALVAAVKGAVAASGVAAEVLEQPVLVIEGLSVVELMCVGQNKAAAMVKILGWLDLPPDGSTMMALGDGRNDLEMLKLAGVPVVMGNAPPALKQEALEGKPRGMVTTTNDECGWQLAIDQLALGQSGRKL
jgi:hypothetical protein